MKRNTFILLFVLLILTMIWGCPTKHYIPDPLPPQPQVNREVHSIEGDHSDLSYNWEDVLYRLKGEAPLVGPSPRFLRMMA